MKSGSNPNSRRQFIQRLTGLAFTGGYVVSSDLFGKAKFKKITILHTNDTHSQIDPFPMNHPRYPGLGGIARRASLIKKIRNEEEHVLLLDSGDIYQGTPYFNMFGGSIEFQLMSQLQYDAATMGNHDFDIGLDGFLKNLPLAKFPFLCSNYDFSKTILEGKTQRYKVFTKDGIRIGVFGLGIDLQWLVAKQLYLETKYQNPIEITTDVAKTLRHDEKCDFVICLSHLGYSSTNPNIITDIRLAQETNNVDIILGAHSHTFLDEPVPYINKDGQQVLVAQTGYAGMRLGRIDVYFDERNKKQMHSAESMVLR